MLHVLGAVALALYIVHAAMSWLLAPFATFISRPYGQMLFFSKIPDAIPMLRGRVEDGQHPLLDTIAQLLRGRGPLNDPRKWLGTASGIGLALTAVAIALLLWIWLERHRLGDRHRRVVHRWAIAFAVVSTLAVPVLVPDFWLSVAWGRALAAGVNPYYEVPAAFVSGLPFDHPIMNMTYGPLWAWASAAIMMVAGGSIWWGALLFKLVLFGLWLGVLRLVHRLTAHRPIVEQCLAIGCIGWLPIGVVQTVAEGHNDVAMVAAVLLWMLLLERGHRTAATLALAASVLFKYASAPLFLIDLLYRPDGDALADAAGLVRRYVPRALAAAALAAVVFAPLFRGPDFFASTSDVHGGFFYLPADVMLALSHLSGLPLRPLGYLVEAVFPVITAVTLYAYAREASPERFRVAVAGMALSLLLVASGHVWPWYVLWLLAPAVLVPLHPLGLAGIGIGVAMYFPLLVWTALPRSSEFVRFHLPSLLAYVAAGAWLLVTWWATRRAATRGTVGARASSGAVSGEAEGR